jgi:hypothetical protein
MDKQQRGEDCKRDLSWWTQNLKKVPAWKIPAGKTSSDFYDSRIPALKDHTLNWPKFPHCKTPDKAKLLCVKYQTVGHCTTKCYLAHVEPTRIDNATKTTFNKRFQMIYA